MIFIPVGNRGPRRQAASAACRQAGRRGRGRAGRRQRKLQDGTTAPEEARRHRNGKDRLEGNGTRKSSELPVFVDPPVRKALEDPICTVRVQPGIHRDATQRDGKLAEPKRANSTHCITPFTSSGALTIKKRHWCVRASRTFTYLSGHFISTCLKS